MNFVSRQAQEAILDPNLPEAYKDEVLGAAVGTILGIAERKKPIMPGAEKIDRYRNPVQYTIAETMKKDRES